jgi:hypothetical protein
VTKLATRSEQRSFSEDRLLNCVLIFYWDCKTDNKITITVEDNGKGFDTKCLGIAKGLDGQILKTGFIF